MESIQESIVSINATLEDLRKGIIKNEKGNKGLYPTYKCRLCHDKQIIFFFGVEFEGFGLCDCIKKTNVNTINFFELRVKRDIPDVWYLDCDNRKGYKAYDRKTFDINQHLILLRIYEIYQTRRKSKNLDGFDDKKISVCENCEKMVLKLQ